MSFSSNHKKSSISPWKNEDLFCHDLPSEPQPDIGKVLITGASGYVGGRLVPELLARGYGIRIMLRAASPAFKELWPGAEITAADALDIDSLKAALKGIHTAYYLIHSLLLGPKEFEQADIQSAINFRNVAEEQQTKRIIYLGGLGDIRTKLSSHLKNRILVAEELQKGSVPVTILRAAVIIGSGSASYEIIKHLVKKLPFIPAPPFAVNKCQPIGIRDVIKYLVGALEIEETSGKSFDIGGSDIITYYSMAKTLSDLLDKKRFFLRIPFSNIQLYSYIASFLTPVPAAITRCLMEGLKNDVICLDHSIKGYLPFRPLSYKEAILKAMTREEQDNVHTRWTGSHPPAHELAIKLHEIEDEPGYTTTYSIESRKSSSALFNSICQIGGKAGWFSNNWMWRLRGWVDTILLGVGPSRGRRSLTTLNINDVIDFWRIEDMKRDKLLLLRAEMKLPGKAWLEFKINDEKEMRKLTITAHYYTSSLPGKMYWYIFLPFHRIIFNNLIKQIEQRS